MLIVNITGLLIDVINGFQTFADMRRLLPFVKGCFGSNLAGLENQTRPNADSRRGR